MNNPDFRELVREMRLAQKHYFVHRDNLTERKRLEREVDAALRDFLAGLSLFDHGAVNEEDRP